MTGASGGIGAAIARELARAGVDLALVARRADALEALAQEIVATRRPAPVVVALDLAAPGAVDALMAALPPERFEIVTLVNNAGFGLVGDAARLPPGEQSAVIDLDVRALVDLTLAVLPRLPRPGGRILNVASLAALAPGPGMAVYYAAKAFVLSFSEALGEELKEEGVVVTALCPGPVATPFWSRAGARTPARSWSVLSAEQVARAGLAGLMAGRRRVVPGVAARLVAALAPVAPRGLALAAMRRFLRARAPR